VSRSQQVAAALIVRDEARFIEGCLERLAGAVDDIVVVDTGSRDGTRDLCARAGVRLIDHVWQDDFSAARNVALNAITCGWILYIDADERLIMPDLRPLSAHVEEHAVAATVRFRPKSGYTRYREIRLFRADPRIRFRGRIHETMVPAIREVAELEHRPILTTDVGIDHLGYDGDQSHKHRRNLPLLEAAVEHHPDRAYYWYHLAETYMALGRKEAAMRMAGAACAAADRDPTRRQDAEANLATHLLVRLQLEARQDPGAWIERGLARMSEDYALWFFQAQAAIDFGDPSLALKIAARLRAINPEDLHEGLIAFEAAIFHEKACELAALAALRLGDRATAAHWYTEAASLAPASPIYALKAAALGAKPLPISQ
jgi:hypothetical protein